MQIFSALLAICVGNSPVPGELPTQRSVTLSFDVFFVLRPNKRLSKHWWWWWLETPSCPLWRHSNGFKKLGYWQWSTWFVVFRWHVMVDIIGSDTKWLPFCRRNIQWHFLEWKLLDFKQNFIDICCLRSIDNILYRFKDFTCHHYHIQGGETEEGNCSYLHIKEAQIRAKYAKFSWMKSCVFGV